MENYDLIIIGAGPAGLSAAIYASRANLKTLVIEASVAGGKLSKTHMIENYPGIKEISGMELADQLVEHGQSFGAKLITETITKIELNDDEKTVETSNGNTYKSKAVIIATGTKEKTLDLEHADEYTGRGVSYCAVCDGFFYRKKPVVVIGGGNSALEESLYLASLCSSVTIVVRRDEFRAEAKVVNKVKENEKINIITRHIPEKLIIEDERITGLMIKNVDTGEIQNVEAYGIFPYIGALPNTELVDPKILDENGYIKVNADMSTSIKGVYGAGDCTDKILRQVVTACNDGAVAANSVIKFLK
ncbi:MAG: thioredoxin-disulfide reductase [Erysipelotrichaceae bacterium]|nr:thioredoxin-disulfide reductase [Erysipelotrichaceae bacterium]